MRKLLLGLLAVLFTGVCYGQQTPVTIFFRPTTSGSSAAPIIAVSGTSPLPVTVVSGSSGGGGTIVSGTVVITGTQGVTQTAALTTTSTFPTGVRKIDMLFSSNFAGTLVVGGTIALNGGTVAAYTYAPPVANTSQSVVLSISTGTASTVAFW